MQEKKFEKLKNQKVFNNTLFSQYYSTSFYED
jgi:hypothetical protein